jgi:hypothetical protein
MHATVRLDGFQGDLAATPESLIDPCTKATLEMRFGLRRLNDDQSFAPRADVALFARAAVRE